MVKLVEFGRRIEVLQTFVPRVYGVRFDLAKICFSLCGEEWKKTDFLLQSESKIFPKEKPRK